MSKNFNFLLFGRFPTERAYGVHIIANARSFARYGSVNIYYPSTSNSKTIQKHPKEYFSNTEDINFIKIDIFDITANKFYELSPKILKQFLWLLFTYLWGKKVSRLIPNTNNEVNWSTSSVLLYASSKIQNQVIYEMHGRARKIQALFLKLIDRKSFFNTLIISTSKHGKKDIEIRNLNNKVYFLPNGVDINLFSQKINHSLDSNILNIGYVGQLNTYGVEKGVSFSIRALDFAIKEWSKRNPMDIYENVHFTVVGGSKNEHSELLNRHKDLDLKLNLIENTNQENVSKYMKEFDIGIVPYPKDEHISLYASPLKLFEYISTGIMIIASDVKSNRLFEDEIGIEFYKAENFDSLVEIFKDCLLKSNRRKIIQYSKQNLSFRENLSWQERTNKIYSILEEKRL